MERTAAARRLVLVREAALHGLLELGEILPDDRQIEFAEDLFLSFPCEQKFESAPHQLGRRDFTCPRFARTPTSSW